MVAAPLLRHAWTSGHAEQPEQAEDAQLCVDHLVRVRVNVRVRVRLGWGSGLALTLTLALALALTKITLAALSEESASDNTTVDASIRYSFSHVPSALVRVRG